MVERGLHIQERYVFAGRICSSAHPLKDLLLQSDESSVVLLQRVSRMLLRSLSLDTK